MVESGTTTYPQISLNFANGHTEKKDQGIVNIQAKEFVPLTVKYIKFTISCGEGENKKTEQVTIKQYPLEYIQAIAGWYSTKSLDGWIDWQEHQKPTKPARHHLMKTSRQRFIPMVRYKKDFFGGGQRHIYLGIPRCW